MKNTGLPLHPNQEITCTNPMTYEEETGFTYKLQKTDLLMNGGKKDMSNLGVTPAGKIVFTCGNCGHVTREVPIDNLINTIGWNRVE